MENEKVIIELLQGIYSEIKKMNELINNTRRSAQKSNDEAKKTVEDMIKNFLPPNMGGAR